MNINELKAYLGDKPKHLGNENSIQNQLRDSGLRQAISVQSSYVSLTVDRANANTGFGARIFANAFNTTLEINTQKPDFSIPNKEEASKSLFDFEEVARNVLNFVGGAIKNAKNSGADEAALNDLFEQASSGVLQGIKLAEQDLAGFLNEEITNGISQSKSLIEQGIENIRRDIFDLEPVEQNEPSQATSTSTSVSYDQLQAGELNIRTRDGDEVRLTFEDIQQFEFNQRQIQQPPQAIEENESTTAPVSGAAQPTTLNPEVAQPAAEANNVAVAQSDSNVVQNENPEAEQQQLPASNEESQEAVSASNVVFYEENSFSFSVTGEQDEDELQAIGQLVADANSLAEEFFNGDIETAFNQALELGFDEQELTGFALQLTKVENTQVIKAYEEVSLFDEQNQTNEPAKAARPVSEYLDKLLDVIGESRLKLEDDKVYENVVNELINRLGEEVHTPDLISAINRFHTFNNRLLDNLPVGLNPAN